MFEYRPFVDQFLDYCRYHKKLSEKTVRAYKIDLSQYALFSDTLSKQALWDYIECLNKKYKPKTVKRKLATLKAFIHFLLLQDYIDFNPFDKLETSIREPVLLPNFFFLSADWFSPKCLPDEMCRQKCRCDRIAFRHRCKDS